MDRTQFTSQLVQLRQQLNIERVPFEGRKLLVKQHWLSLFATGKFLGFEAAGTLPDESREEFNRI